MTNQIVSMVICSECSMPEYPKDIKFNQDHSEALCKQCFAFNSLKELIEKDK